MTPNSVHSLSRQELNELVWSTPMSRLAPQFGLSDVGLAKVCKRHAIPRSPVGYWAKLQHGKSSKKPPHPDPPAGMRDEIRIENRPKPAEANDDVLQFFDADIEALSTRVEDGEFIQHVGETLRGCHPLTGRTRDWLKAVSRQPTRNRWGALETPERYEGSHVIIDVSKDQHRRALLLLDAAIKLLTVIGARLIEPEDRWDRTVAFELRELEFGVRIKERNRQVPHVLTKEEVDQKRRIGSHWGPKYDHIPTGELRFELTYPRTRSPFAQFKDGKRAKVESMLNSFALSVLRRADDRLRRKADEEEARRLAAERARLARVEEEHRRVEEARRQAELDRRERLYEISDSWERGRSLQRFLDEFKHQLEDPKVAEPDRGILTRWHAWAMEVCDSLDPMRGGLMWLPEFTHPEEFQPPKTER